MPRRTKPCPGFSRLGFFAKACDFQQGCAPHLLCEHVAHFILSCLVLIDGQEMEGYTSGFQSLLSPLRHSQLPCPVLPDFEMCCNESYCNESHWVPNLCYRDIRLDITISLQWGVNAHGAYLRLLLMIMATLWHGAGLILGNVSSLMRFLRPLGARGGIAWIQFESRINT